MLRAVGRYKTDRVYCLTRSSSMKDVLIGRPFAVLLTMHIDKMTDTNGLRRQWET